MSGGIERAVEFAWKVHDAIDSWTAKVDSKASIVLAIESGAVGLLVALTQGDGKLKDVSGNLRLVLNAGWVFLGLSVAIVAGVVFPQLGRPGLKKRASTAGGLIYFGHLRSRSPGELAETLADLTDRQVIAELAQQHIVMSKIAWRKHAWLQASMVIFSVGMLFFLAAGLL